MLKKSLAVLILVLAVSAVPALASSSFQYTCSNIDFAYSGTDAALVATCLKADGTPNSSKLILQGISNENGNLVQGSGSSSFQKSCGNIQIEVDGANVTLSALCRTGSGGHNSTSLPLNGIGNDNGNLTQ